MSLKHFSAQISSPLLKRFTHLSRREGRGSYHKKFCLWNVLDLINKQDIDELLSFFLLQSAAENHAGKTLLKWSGTVLIVDTLAQLTSESSLDQNHFRQIIKVFSFA